MGGFLATSTPMTVYKVEGGEFSMDALRKRAFELCDLIHGHGFVGLGDRLDTQNFELALMDGRFSGFSFRQDERIPSKAAVKLEADKRVRAIELTGKKVGRKAKKEIAEKVYIELRDIAPFVPMVTDIIWDCEKKRMFASTNSPASAMYIPAILDQAFGMTADLIEGGCNNLPSVFKKIQSGLTFIRGYEVCSLDSATLTAVDAEDGSKPVVTVKDDTDILNHALDASMDIVRIKLAARRMGDALGETLCSFALDQKMRVSGLSFPKPEDKKDIEANFIINAGVCAVAADIVEAIANNEVDV